MATLQEQMSAADFWTSDRAQAAARHASQLERTLKRWEALERRLEDAAVLLELAEEEADPAAGAEVATELREVAGELRKMELQVLLNGPYDSHDAILSLHPGAGGTESQDWAEMLMRMYLRWAERRGFVAEVLDRLEGEEAGIKSVTLSIRGENAYGFLKTERGVHRLVRISPFDVQGRRHTSFASVDVLPQVEDEGEVEIRPEDLRIDTYRSSGAGGQHVNKTESAVRITHLPTGIVVTCQSERSQHANRETAMQILRARLLKLREEERERELADLRGPQAEIAWGNQIRSYVLHPYTLVKDHRTNVEVGNAYEVLDGDLDPFIYAMLELRAAERTRTG
ncbi:MAG: peptide chain release factor 2 [Clostridia bacterium]|nr:peptide chain release factor 2 [Clostridia bacterium]